MTSILQGHFVFDPSKFNDQIINLYKNDRVFFISAIDGATNKTIGFITFLIRQNYTQGDVKVMSFAVEPNHQKRGIGKLLMSSIFKIEPTIKRMLLGTRVTNKAALHAYRSWGFVLDEKPVLDHAFNLDHWTFMEYQSQVFNFV